MNDIEDFNNQFFTAVTEKIKPTIAFMTNKEQTDQELAVKL